MESLTVDGMSGKIYWLSDNREAGIVRLESADLDGQNLKTIVSSTNTISTFAVPSALIDIPPGNVDVNEDGNINVYDLLIIMITLGKKAELEPRADVNKDGNVTVADLVLVIENLDDPFNAAAPALGDITNQLSFVRP